MSVLADRSFVFIHAIEGQHPKLHAYGKYRLPIRSIDFYYPEFQAATVRISRDKSTMCFLKPIWSNLCRNFLNLLYNTIYSVPTKSNNFPKGMPHIGGGLKCGNFGSQIGIRI